MKKISGVRLLFFLLLILFPGKYSFSQGLTVSLNQLIFADAFENAPDSLQILVINNLNHDVSVTGIKFYNTYGSPAFSANPSSFTIPSSSSQPVWIKFSPYHNIWHNSELVIENDALRGYVSIDLQGQGKYSSTYYNATENLSEESLKTAIHTITGIGYDTLGYNIARDSMFMWLDNQRTNGQGAAQNTLECIYTGRIATGYTSRSDCQTSDSFNTEHTFPQSFFGSAEPMKSDLHHLFPTDDDANNKRNNSPFGVVVNPDWAVGGSQSINNTLFEPRDQQKGATARAMMYFVLRYQNYMSFLTSQESILRTWHHNFPPSQVEWKRNNDINIIQHNRNPFVDYPKFIERINSISNLSVAPVAPSIDLTQDTIIYGYVQQSVSNVFHYVIVNNGNTSVHFSNFSLSNPGILSFQSGGSNTVIAPGDALGIDINLVTANQNTVHGLLTFNTDVPSHNSVSIPIYANDSLINSVPEINDESISVFPNPVKELLVVKYAFHEDAVLKIFDLAGKEIMTAKLLKNSFSQTLDVSAIENGMYFLKADSGKRMLFQKFVKQ